MPAEGHRRATRHVVLLLLAAAGAAGGMFVTARVRTDIGPFHVSLALRPAWLGDTVVELPPLGSLRLDTHDGPVGMVVRADEIDPDAARSLAESPEDLRQLDDELPREVRDATRGVLWRAIGGAVVGAIFLVLVREWSRAAAVEGLVVALVLGIVVAGTARATWRSDAIAEPRYEGLIAAAPQAVGSVEDIQRRFDEYTDQLVGLVDNSVALYQAVANLESFKPDASTVRVLHVSDLHLNPQAFELIAELVAQFSIDAVVDTGDIVDWGTSLETRYTDMIGRLGVPYLFVRGNHDSFETTTGVAAQQRAVVLDRTGTSIRGIRFWGVADPRFTPDKSSGGEDEERDRIDALASRLPRLVPRDADVVLVHDPAAARSLAGRVPLVLSGHTHRADQRELVDARRGRTLQLVSGSTGGAGLRALRGGDEPEPLTAAVLYFDPREGRLVAYDRVELAGLGRSEVRIQRRLVDVDDADEASATRSAGDLDGVLVGKIGVVG